MSPLRWGEHVAGPDEPGAGCARVQGRLEELLDGGLEPLAAARDAGHIEACAACAAERAAWLRLAAAAREAARPDPAELEQALSGLPARLEAGLASRRPPRPRARPLGLVSLATAAAALCALLALERGGAAPPADAELFARLAPRLAGVERALPDWRRLLAGALGGGGER